VLLQGQQAPVELGVHRLALRKHERKLLLGKHAASFEAQTQGPNERIWENAAVAQPRVRSFMNDREGDL
jgi:hypothetical protein